MDSRDNGPAMTKHRTLAARPRITQDWKPMRASSDAGMALEVAGTRVPVFLRVNPRARRLILRVAQGTREVVVVAPSKRELKDALAFAERQRPWIAARLAEQAPPVEFAPGAEIPILGRRHTIEHRPFARAGAWIEESGDLRLCVSGGQAHVARRTEDFLKRLARAHLAERTHEHCARLGVAPPKLSIRDPATRWGSCSPASGISFSWRLVLAPPRVLDYVAAHEAAHLVHMNHSKAFWRLLATLVPDVRGPVRWLATDGRDLHRYGRSDA